MKKTLKLNCFLAKVPPSRHTKCISPPYSRIFVAKQYKNKNLRCSFKATANAAVKDKIYCFCSMPELSERNFCDGFEIKFTSLLSVIQQAGAPETAAKSVNSLIYFRLVITSANTQVCISLSLTSTQSLNLR